ncbi:hypothetical protein [Streptosporangium sp. NPDC004631]
MTRLAEEVRGVDSEASQLAADVRVISARGGDAETAEDVGDTQRVRRGFGQHFGGVFVFAGHAPSLRKGSDNSWSMRRPRQTVKKGD